MPAPKKPASTVIEIPETTIGTLEVGILGKTPFIHNRLAEKARQQLLLPSGPKNAAEKASSLKHDPISEFKSSPYILDSEDDPTLLGVMASAFKGAAMTAALDLPGVNKSQIGRLVWVDGFRLPMWGDLKLMMTIVRSADMNRTPDVRTRAISPEWGTILTVSFVKPLVTERVVLNLLSTGGRSSGVGDWRPEKGHGVFGQFELVNTDDPRLKSLMENHGREMQTKALEAAEPFDGESAELLGWFEAERQVRGR